MVVQEASRTAQAVVSGRKIALISAVVLAEDEPKACPIQPVTRREEMIGFGMRSLQYNATKTIG